MINALNCKLLLSVHVNLGSVLIDALHEIILGWTDWCPLQSVPERPDWGQSMTDWLGCQFSPGLISAGANSVRTELALSNHQSLKVLIFKTKLDPQSWYPRDSFLIVERPREIELGVNIDHDAIVQYGHKDDTSLLFIDTNGEHQLNWENNSNNIP